MSFSDDAPKKAVDFASPVTSQVLGRSKSHARTRSRALRRLLLFILLGLGTLCAGNSARAAEEILIGASVPLSGPLAAFGTFEEWGYKRAIDEANKAGGLAIGGQKRPVRLVIRDDKTDPSTVASNTETLISRDKVVAMLGSCTPALVNAGALVAERHKVPMVTGCNPLEAFKSVRKWNWVWDLFFDESNLAAASIQAMDGLGLETNRKVVILHDNGPDGQAVGGQLWPRLAKEHGFEVVQNASFPVDNTQFTSILEEAKAKGADIVLVDSITPQAVSLCKQMASAGFAPKILVIEKGAEPVQFSTALGSLADGVMVGGYWDPSFPYPGAGELAKAYETETGRGSSQHIADTYAAAQVLLDSIAAAGNTDAADINAAIAKTDKTYVVGPIKFDADHTARLPMVLDQWQGGKTVVIWPKDQATGKPLFPLPR